MNRRIQQNQPAAFTLVELLVVISIIGLLIGIALPAFKHARIAAKRTASEAVLTSISDGLTMYRAENALGGGYPPSATDIPPGGSKGGKIINPMANHNPGQYLPVSGASLLVYALAGPDQRGTAGFRATGTNAYWGDSIGGPGTAGLYDMDDDGGTRPLPPRYGPYAGDKLLNSIRPAAGKTLDGKPWGLLNINAVRPVGNSKNILFDTDTETEVDFDQIEPIAQQLFFVDGFDQPILYYRARRAARNLVTNPDDGKIGVYDHRDNALLTAGHLHMGSVVARSAALRNAPAAHDIDTIRRDPNEISDLGNFAKYIINSRSLRTVPSNFDDLQLGRPVNEDTFLLISPGADGIYGTGDDLKNWGK